MPDMAPTMAKLKSSLESHVRELGDRPKAVLVISGHWEEREFTVSSSPTPPMIYDYGGFPAHTYRIQYSAPGDPALAKRVQGLLQEAGIPSRLDSQRGYDHGTFVPLAVMFPEADVPVVQLSLRMDFDPAAHLAVGRAIAPLRDEGVLIVGSGVSYHNLRQFGPTGRGASLKFDAWLQDVLIGRSPEDRTDQLVHWTEAPAARLAHPREEHLLPLMVAVGAAHDEAGACVYHEDDFFGSLAVSSFRFGRMAS
jgi:aromatic ring-opening dioxygenase catalytic subunit (LigB family)